MKVINYIVYKLGTGIGKVSQVLIRGICDGWNKSTTKSKERASE